MKFVNMFMNDMKKTIGSIGFLLAIFVTTILLFSSTAYIDDKGQAFSIMECVFFQKDILLNDYNFSSIMIFRKGMQGYITLFIPIIASFPFVKSFCEEKNTGIIRFMITRTGRRVYYYSKVMTALLSGGLAIMLGVLFFGGMVSILFPGSAQYNQMSASVLQSPFVNNICSIVVKELVSSFLYGVVMTLPALVCCSFCKNPYLIAGIPFFSVYIQQILVNKLYQNKIESGEFEPAGKIYDFSPGAIKTIFDQMEQPESVKRILVVNAVLLVISVTCYIKISLWQRDHG